MITLVWGDLAPVVSAMIVDQPRIAARLALAPRRTLHALAAYVQHAISKQMEIRRIAEEIHTEHVRTLLSEAVSDLHPRLYRTLDRLGPSVRNLTFYLRLNEVVLGPTADLLVDLEDINENHLDIVREIIADPVLLAARKAIQFSSSDLQHLKVALVYLRGAGLARDIEFLPPDAGWKAINRRLSNDMGRARAPAPEFAAPNEWRQIENVADLWRVGKMLGNCLVSFNAGSEDYVWQFVTGEAKFLVHDDEPVMLACVRKVGPNLWTLSETSTSRRRAELIEPSKGLRAKLSIAVAATGGELVHDSPLSAMRSIAWRAEHGADIDNEELEDAA